MMFPILPLIPIVSPLLDGGDDDDDDDEKRLRPMLVLSKVNLTRYSTSSEAIACPQKTAEEGLNRNVCKSFKESQTNDGFTVNVD